MGVPGGIVKEPWTWGLPCSPFASELTERTEERYKVEGL